MVQGAFDLAQLPVNGPEVLEGLPVLPVQARCHGDAGPRRRRDPDGKKLCPPLLEACGPAQAILGSPAHPYTRALLAAVPRIDGQRQDAGMVGTGDLPSAFSPPPGCHFHPRCPNAGDICRREYPLPVMLSATGEVSCFLYSVGNAR